jgi:hypothetical protein
MSDETKHSLEPWRQNPEWPEEVKDAEDLVCAEGWPARDLDSPDFYRQQNRQNANARRIVAAVNACAGISTAALESGVVGELLSLVEDAFAEADCDGEEGLATVEGVTLNCPSCKAVALLKRAGRLP